MSIRPITCDTCGGPAIVEVCWPHDDTHIDGRYCASCGAAREAVLTAAPARRHAAPAGMPADVGRALRIAEEMRAATCGQCHIVHADFWWCEACDRTLCAACYEDVTQETCRQCRATKGGT